MVVIINNNVSDVDETENHEELSGGGGGLPPGFRFHPTDEEIVSHYLTPKVINPNFTATAIIGEADLNKSEPWELPKIAKMQQQQGEKEWFFFCQRDRKYPTGMRTNRATQSGYWKATGKDKHIFRRQKLVGMKKTLVFYKGRAPKGEKTNWVMHEFRLEGSFSYYTCMPPARPSNEDEWVVCRVFHKNTGPHRSPITEHGLTSFVDQDDGPPHFIDLSPLNLDPTFNSYFSHDQHETDDHHNILLSSYNYMNFNSKCYHNTSPMFINDHEVGVLQNTDHGSNINDTTDDVTTAETSSVSMLPKHASLRRKDYNYDLDGDDDVGPSKFSELDYLLVLIA